MLLASMPQQGTTILCDGQKICTFSWPLTSFLTNPLWYQYLMTNFIFWHALKLDTSVYDFLTRKGPSTALFTHRHLVLNFRSLAEPAGKRGFDYARSLLYHNTPRFHDSGYVWSWSFSQGLGWFCCSCCCWEMCLCLRALGQTTLKL